MKTRVSELTGATITTYEPGDIAPGDRVRIDGQLFTVESVNDTDITLQSWPSDWTAPYHYVKDVRKA